MSNQTSGASTDITNPPISEIIGLGASGAVVRLDAPIRRGDQTIDSVTLRKPSAGELRGIKLNDLLQMDVSALSTLLPRISAPTLTAADVAKLDPADLVSMATEVGNFFLSKAMRASLTV